MAASGCTSDRISVLPDLSCDPRQTYGYFYNELSLERLLPLPHSSLAFCAGPCVPFFLSPTAVFQVFLEHLPEFTPTARTQWCLKPTHSDMIMSAHDCSFRRKDRREGHSPVQIPGDTGLASGLWPS